MSFNANGIRSAARKGFFDWLHDEDVDIVCIQETKAQIAQLEADPTFFPEGYVTQYVEAEKKGYSGVGILSRKKPTQIHTSFGYALADQEGRFIQFDYEHFSVISLYLPSGTSGEHRQEVKYAFLEAFEAYLNTLKASGRKYIICGDYNIAHKIIDIKNWRANQKNSGFLPEERAWLDKVFGDMGFVDAFRVVSDAEAQYTWWSQRGQARANNVGWRIDYQVVTNNVKPFIQDACIKPEPYFSDHAPLILDYDEALYA